MMGYFKPWRRKLGVLTLVLASVFMACWVRSLAIIDSFNYSNRGSQYRGMSVDGRVELRIFDMRRNIMPSGFASRPFWPQRFEDEALAQMIRSAKRRLETLQQTRDELTPAQFEDLESTAMQLLREWESLQPAYAIPYWSIVVPLTLLSAWLLLSKPRAKASGPTQS